MCFSFNARQREGKVSSRLVLWESWILLLPYAQSWRDNLKGRINTSTTISTWENNQIGIASLR